MNSSKNKKISIITVNWNGYKWLDKFLKSVKNQSYKNIEVIFVDNNSSDKSVSFVESKYPFVKIVKNKKNYGLAKATNIGVKNSSGEFIVFINNDTWFEKDLISKLMDFYNRNNFIAVSPAEKRYFKDIEFKCNTTIDITGSPAYFVPTYSKPEKIFYLTVCFMCKKKDFIDSNGMDEDFFMYYEDVDWFWRLFLLGHDIGVDVNSKIFHVGAGSTGDGLKTNFFLWRNQNTLQTLLKNYSASTLLFTLPIYFIQNIFEFVFFLLILKPNISKTYIQGWVYNYKNLNKIIKKRKQVQSTRLVSDKEVFGKMYFGLGKAIMLKDFINKI